ncbi:hypothetical protein ACFFWC_14320 [Plantactinospora siamensis]|uniref:Uncharacterized protein n=1 Tax=Plantactinospora siamensis TaxID=555372 RepID=A0ABV6P3C4_9ACTN
MAPRSDRAAREHLDRAETYLRVAGAGARAGAAGPALTRAHTADARTVGWYGPPPPGHRLAIDAEVADGAVPPALGRRFGTADFWARWTRAESLCKAYDLPIAVWLRRYGLDVPDRLPGLWRTLTLGDLTVSVACVPTGAAGEGGG